MARLTGITDMLARGIARGERSSVRVEWATGVGARQVVMDTSPEVVLDLSASAIGDLTAGQRVLTIRDGRRLTAVATPSIADRLAALAASTPRVQTGVVSVPLSNAAYGQISVPLSGFTDTTRMVALGNATNHDTRYVVRTYVNGASSATIGVRHIDGTAVTATIPVAWAVIQS